MLGLGVGLAELSSNTSMYDESQMECGMGQTKLLHMLAHIGMGIEGRPGWSY